jgi:hypothetical protein
MVNGRMMPQVDPIKKDVWGGKKGGLGQESLLFTSEAPTFQPLAQVGARGRSGHVMMLSWDGGMHRVCMLRSVCVWACRMPSC